MSLPILTVQLGLPLISSGCMEGGMWLSPHMGQQDQWATNTAPSLQGLSLYPTIGHLPLKSKHLLLSLQKATALQTSSHHPTQRISSLLDVYMFINRTVLSSDVYLYNLMCLLFYIFIVYFVLTAFFLIPTFRSLCGQPIKYLKSSQMLSDSFTKHSTQLGHI